MPNNSSLLSILKTAVANLEEVRAKIEQLKSREVGGKKRQSPLRAYEDPLAARLW